MKVLNNGKIPAVLAVTLTLVTTGFYAPAVYSSSAIAEAVQMGDLTESRQLISAGVDVNDAEPDGTTPLLWATYNSSLELVNVLLDAGADPNVPNNLDITPLLQASRNGHAEIIQALLAGGAKLETPELEIETPLMAAARSGNVAAVKILLDAGSNPNATEGLDKQTALMWSVAAGNQDVAAVLLDAGADPNITSRVSELTKRSFNADFPSGGFAALHWAARNGDEAMIRLLLDKGADINVKNGDESSPMMLAIVNDRFDIASLLLDFDADANDGSLFYATEMRDATTDWRAKDGTIFRADHPNELSALELTRLLLEAGADPDKPFIGQMHNATMCCDIKSNQTPFYRAAKAADITGLTMMLEYGADPNWKPESETRPIGIAGEEEEIVSRTALMMAISGGKGVGVSGGPNDLRYGPPPFREEGLRDPAQAVKILLEAGADTNVPGPDSTTALHIAAKELDPDMVRALVSHGADLNALNKEELTPLQEVEEMTPPAPRSGFYFEPPPVQPNEMVALLTELASIEKGSSE